MDYSNAQNALPYKALCNMHIKYNGTYWCFGKMC